MLSASSQSWLTAPLWCWHVLKFKPTYLLCHWYGAYLRAIPVQNRVGDYVHANCRASCFPPFSCVTNVMSMTCPWLPMICFERERATPFLKLLFFAIYEDTHALACWTFGQAFLCPIQNRCKRFLWKEISNWILLSFFCFIEFLSIFKTSLNL